MPALCIPALLIVKLYLHPVKLLYYYYLILVMGHRDKAKVCTQDFRCLSVLYL